MKHTQTHAFSVIPKANIPRSTFDRSHGHKTTLDAGLLVPVYVDEALPGDTINLTATFFARLATPIVPAMDNLWMDVFFFAIPNRLVWDNWQKFMGEQTNPGDSTDFIVPVVTDGGDGFGRESIYDYMGIPPSVPNLEVNALFLRAYNLVFNEWFRDQNLRNSVTVPKGNGPDTEATYQLLRAGKRHDYFTSALPWPQKGDGVELPVGATAPVLPNFAETGIPTFNVNYNQERAVIGIAGPNMQWGTPGTWGPESPTTGGPAQWADPQLVADLSQATSITINSLRQAFQLQRLLERDARGGTRYTEILRAHFNVVSPDARLQRPEYLGGGTLPVNIHPVPQTSGSAADPATGYTETPQGNLATFGTVSGTAPGFTKSFTEHSIILGIVRVRADLTYQQGLARMWTRSTKYDFYWPALSHLGEQAIRNEEIYAQDGSILGTSQQPINKETFGYQERWAEYRYAPSRISGQFRSSFPTSLDTWHFSQDFTSLPTLSQTFIEENPPIDRNIATPDYPHFLVDSYFRVKAARPMPTYSVPGLIDHF